MIWTRLLNFFARYWHWFFLLVVILVFFALTVRQCDSARVYVFGPSDKVTVKVK